MCFMQVALVSFPLLWHWIKKALELDPGALHMASAKYNIKGPVQ